MIAAGCASLTDHSKYMHPLCIKMVRFLSTLRKKTKANQSSYKSVA